MNKRRIYVNLTEINYRALRRLGVYTGECAGMLAERLLTSYVADHILRDDNFARWIEAEQRDITYGSAPAPDIRHLHTRPRRSGINPERDDDDWPRSPQD